MPVVVWDSLELWGMGGRQWDRKVVLLKGEGDAHVGADGLAERFGPGPLKWLYRNYRGSACTFMVMLTVSGRAIW